jgi:hypothetical protein
MSQQSVMPPTGAMFGDLAAVRACVIGQTVSMDREGRQELHYRAADGDIPGIRDRLAAGDDIGLADRQAISSFEEC